LSISRKTIELLKTILILLLTINALFLAWRTGLFSDAIAAFPMIGNVAQLMRPATSSEEPRTDIVKEAARPIAIVITNEQGERFGVRGETVLKNSLYDRLAGTMGEAMGSASNPVEISSDQWRAALSGSSVLFEYITPINLPVIAEWFGAGASEVYEDIYIRRIFISFGEDRSRLYFQDHKNGLYFGADTASTAGKAQELSGYLPNGALFAFETGYRGYENAPYQLIMPGVYFPNIRSEAPGSQQEMLEKALTVFGHYAEVHRTYTSADVLVGVGTQFNIRISVDGQIIYRRTDMPEADAEEPLLTLSEMIERARIITEKSIGEKSGEAEVNFEAIIYSEGIYNVYFGYYIAGGRVYLYEDRHASVISFSSGIITDAELNIRSFFLSGEYTRLLPERQALAAANGEFILSYSDAGQEILHPAWVRIWF